MQVFLEYRGSSFRLAQGETLLGRDGSCRFRFQDESVSRRHLRIVVGQDEITVEDLGSTNGTLLNGRLLLHAEKLYDGDVMQIGKGVFKVQIEPDERRPTASKRRPTAPIRIPPAVFAMRSMGNAKPQDRRRQKRYPVNISAMYSSSSLSRTARVHNLSPGGAFISGDLQDPVITPCQVTLLPDGSPPLSTRGIVRHVIPPRSGGSHPPGLGIKFTEMDSEARQWLAKTCKDPA
jgi:pSer/pThr/pTyr-binding forkhead associated (FHA) protein